MILVITCVMHAKHILLLVSIDYTQGNSQSTRGTYLYWIQNKSSDIGRHQNNELRRKQWGKS